MITSIVKNLGKAQVPSGFFKLQTIPFMLDTLSGVPHGLTEVVERMIRVLPYRSDRRAFLTVDGRIIKAGQTHRRPGPHIDGNYIPGVTDWGGGGWKVGDDGRTLTPEAHAASYDKLTGGVIMLADQLGCRGWVGNFPGKAGIGGDCSHIELGTGFLLEPNSIYYGNNQFIHESIPVKKDMHRTLIRINLDQDYPALSL